MHVNCGSNESIYDATARMFGPGCKPVVKGMGTKHPEEPGMVGTVTVRPGESFAVVPIDPSL